MLAANHRSFQTGHLRNQLNNTAGLLDLSLSLLAEVSCSYNHWDLWEAALSEDLGVAKWEEVEDWGGVGLLVADVGITGFGGDERP